MASDPAGTQTIDLTNGAKVFTRMWRFYELTGVDISSTPVELSVGNDLVPGTPIVPSNITRGTMLLSDFANKHPDVELDPDIAESTTIHWVQGQLLVGPDPLALTPGSEYELWRHISIDPQDLPAKAGLRVIVI